MVDVGCSQQRSSVRIQLKAKIKHGTERGWLCINEIVIVSSNHTAEAYTHTHALAHSHSHTHTHATASIIRSHNISTWMVSTIAVSHPVALIEVTHHRAISCLFQINKIIHGARSAHDKTRIEEKEIVLLSALAPVPAPTTSLYYIKLNELVTHSRQIEEAATLRKNRNTSTAIDCSAYSFLLCGFVWKVFDLAIINLIRERCIRFSRPTQRIQ